MKSVTGTAASGLGAATVAATKLTAMQIRFIILFLSARIPSAVRLKLFGKVSVKRHRRANYLSNKIEQMSELPAFTCEAESLLIVLGFQNIVHYRVRIIFRTLQA